MEIIMPKMGESINEGTIIKWHKKVGDTVNQDEIIFEISTDKVDTEIPAPASGLLKEIKFNEGDTVEVGKVVAVLDSNGSEEQPVDDSRKTESNAEAESDHREEIEDGTSAAENENSSGEIINIEMPKMGESVMEGTIIKWYKKVGDNVGKDETIFEISTDKVDTEIPSPVNGILSEILIGEQETAEVGTVVAKISTGSLPAVSAEKDTKSETTIPETDSSSMHDSFSKTVLSKEEGEDKESRRFYSPLVLNIARKEGIGFEEIQRIKGTGLNERVTKKDILTYIKNRTAQPPEPEKPGKEIQEEKVPAAPAPAFIPPESSTADFTGSVEKIPMDNVRQKIMEHMVASRDTSVHEPL